MLCLRKFSNKLKFRVGKWAVAPPHPTTTLVTCDCDCEAFFKPLTLSSSHILQVTDCMQPPAGGSTMTWLIFSRSYCYTVWSAIGIILLSVRLSVRLSVTLCTAFWLSGLVYAAKSCTSVFLAGMFLFALQTLWCRMYRLATKCATKKWETP